MTESWGTEVLVVGAGPAGLATSIELARRGRRVLLAERSLSNRRKLCGEFLSGDGCQVLKELGGELTDDCPRIDGVLLTGMRGRGWQTSIPGLGRGCSRQRLGLILASVCDDLGVKRLRGVRVEPGPGHNITARRGTVPVEIEARMTVHASGRAGSARLRPSKGRRGRRQWLAVAVHGRGRRSTQVQLHATGTGYVGVNGIEGDRINVCALLRAPGTAVDPLQRLMSESTHNPLLHNYLSSITFDDTSVCTVAGLDFGRQSPPRSITVGDAAGAPTPLLGQGLAAALRGGQMLGKMADDAMQTTTTTSELSARYQRAWRAEFGRRFALGRHLQRLIMQPLLAEIVLLGLRQFPRLGERVVRATRGPLPVVS